MPNLKSLYIKLESEDRVNALMETLDTLEYLNGLPLEHEETAAEQDSFGTDEDFESEVRETIYEFLEKVVSN